MTIDGKLALELSERNDRSLNTTKLYCFSVPNAQGPHLFQKCLFQVLVRRGTHQMKKGSVNRVISH